MPASLSKSISCAHFAKQGVVFLQSKKNAGGWQAVRRLYVLGGFSGPLALNKSFFQHLLVAEPQIGDIG
jgi:hypothetical protein